MIHFVYLLFNQEINLNQKLHYENLILLGIGKHNLSLKGSVVTLFRAQNPR